MANHSLVRPLTSAEDLLQFNKIEAAAFVSSFDPASYEYKPHTGPSEIWGFGSPATSAMVIHDFGVWFDGHLVNATGVGGVASLPESRGQGGIREIFAALLPAWRENDVVFSLLYPFSHRFYRKFGYELVQRMHRYTLPMESLAGFPCEAAAELLTDFSSLQKLHRDFGVAHNLYILRKDAQWNHFKKDPFLTRTYTYRVGKDAYVTFRPQDPARGQDGYTLKVLDMAYQNSASLRALFGFLYGLRAQYSQVMLELPPSVPLMHMIPECYDVSLSVVAKGMARIVHVQRALELMRYPQEAGSFTLQVSDAFLPANSGCYVIRYENGHAISVTMDDFCGRPDLIVSIQVLTQLVSGSLTLEEALYLPDVTCLVNPSRLQGIFPRKDLFFTDGF